ncbi:MAG TPA: vitamin B12 dependent-methionine synthase activation domain-containing protein, partial [Acidimicrobiales bacterium]|nr:vitamin B12 dependent-methionine synthase activation domain-containing protein [Acidimicrobiales bacterium]
IKSKLPGCFTVLGLSNVSFGLNPAARHVLNSVYLHECVKAGLDCAIAHAGRIIPLNRIDDKHRQICLDLIYDKRIPAAGSGLDPGSQYDPLKELLAAFEGVSAQGPTKQDRSGWPVERRLSQRIIDGERDGLDLDLAEALKSGLTALEIVNDVLLEGMKVVGDLFASGEMQLPFVLQSAETMKTAVTYLEPHMDKSQDSGKGRVVLATVKGDVHDIGKNLVDIILTNNGYEVHNLGIKVPVAEMVDKAQQVKADAIGMSGLLVKSTLIMRENLEELNSRGLSTIPVLLGGAALTRTYVERDLRSVYSGRLFYGKDAFEGLRTMNRLMEMKKSGEEDPQFGRELSTRQMPMRKSERDAIEAAEKKAAGLLPVRSPEVESDNEVPKPPFTGSRVAKGIAIDEIAGYLNETALFRNQWGLRPNAGEEDSDFKERVRPTLREQIAIAKTKGVLSPQAVWGYFPANAQGDDLIIWTDDSRNTEATRFSFPRQGKEPYLCIADFFRSVESGEQDWAGFTVVTMGSKVSEETAKLFTANKFQDYLYLHGLGVELAEALAEYMHKRVRDDWGFGDQDGPTLWGLFRQQYRGGRYSFGYPACPDLEDNAKVVELLDASRIGVEVSEGFQLHPEQTTLALICHHEKAKYFVAR